MRKILESISGTIWGLIIIILIILIWWTFRWYTGIPPIPGVEDIIKKVFGVS